MIHLHKAVLLLAMNAMISMGAASELALPATTDLIQKKMRIKATDAYPARHSLMKMTA
jgi:hypothetical protein